jgi:3-hydroxybutyryl-CoA dehydrogenase
MVAGAGTMGAAIAQVAAVAGYKVVLRDLEQKFLDRGLDNITFSLERMVRKGALTERQKADSLERITASTSLDDAAECDLVIEAIAENLEQKLALFRELDKVCPEATLFATNTSSLSVTEMAVATSRPARFVGTHFFNPVPVMKLVELVRGPLTGQEAIDSVREVLLKMGKEPVDAKDTPGFIFNRLIVPYLNEAIWALYEGVASAADIDKAMKLGGNMPIGPLALVDLIGLDVQLHVTETFHVEFGDPKFRACPLLRQMVRAGLLGKKSRQGFFKYE